MAIISIPSSVGGVNIPGALVKGPLGALFGSKYKKDFLQYPSDLSSATKGHVVQFSINEIDAVKYKQVKTDLIFEKKNLVTDAIQFVKDAGASVIESVNLTLEPQKKRNIATISLYIPDTVNFTYNSHYGNLSLNDAIKDVVGSVGKAAEGAGGGRKNGVDASVLNKYGRLVSAAASLAGAAQSSAGKLFLKSQGLAINPNQQLLFDGIDFRSYQMAFTFTPYTREEADTVKKIINLFKEHSAPLITSGVGMFFIPPSTFDVKFLFNNKENRNINRVAESVIESIEVNYAPNGWAAHDDGAPVQTTLTIGFKEIELIDRTKIQQGY
jgi:hypothetical protein